MYPHQPLCTPSGLRNFLLGSNETLLVHADANDSIGSVDTSSDGTVGSSGAVETDKENWQKGKT